MTNKYIERLMPITHHQLPVTHDGREKLLAVKLLNFRRAASSGSWMKVDC